MGHRGIFNGLLVLSLAVILFSSIQTVSNTSAASISQYSDVNTWEAALENPNARQDIHFDFIQDAPYNFGPIIEPTPLGTELITPQGIVITDLDGIIADRDDNDMIIILLNSDATIVIPSPNGGAGITDSFKHDQGNGVQATDFDGDTDKARGFKSPGTQNFIGFTSPAGIEILTVGKGGNTQLGIDILHVELNTPPVAYDDPELPVDPDSFSAAQGVPHNEPADGVLGNDEDIDNDPLTAVLDTTTANGALTLNLDGSFDYTSNGGFVGFDEFTYFANDGFSDSLSPATVEINVYTAEIAHDQVTIESVAVIVIEDHRANTDDATIQTVGFELESIGAGLGQTPFTATESSLVPGIFNAKITVSDTLNQAIDLNVLNVILNTDNEDTITLTYLEATDTATVDNGETVSGGLEATSTEPLRWDSDIYQVGNAASLSSFLPGGVGDLEHSVDTVWVRTSTNPVGFVMPIEEGNDDGILHSPSQLTLLYGGPSDPILFELAADADDILEATLVSSLTGGEFETFRTYDWQIDEDFDGVEDGAGFPTYGGTGDFPIIGNWDSSISGESIGIFRSPTGLLVLDDNGNGVYNPETDSVLFGFGTVGTVPAIGDWNGNGEDSVAVFTPSTGVWDVDTDGSGAIDVTSEPFGGVRDFPIVGDWNGDGIDQIGIFRHAGGLWAFDTDGDFLNDVVAENGEDLVFVGFGQEGDVPVVGDFDTARAGIEIGLYRPSTGEWFFDDNVDGIIDFTVPEFGGPGDIPLIGDWNGDGQDDLGIYRPDGGLWALDEDGDRENDTGKNGNDNDLIFFSGGVGDIPMVGDFDGDGQDGVAILIVEPPNSDAIVATSGIVQPDLDTLTTGSGFLTYTAEVCAGNDDDDNDGICDSWIVTKGNAKGITFDIGGTTHHQGCRPLLVDTADAYLDTGNGFVGVDVCPVNERKQMFYEIDYMTGHKPLQEAIENVITTFQNAPVANDDGSTGIDLFVTVDEDYGTHIIEIPFSGDDENPGYDQFKESFFGTAIERDRADADGFLAGKFQYTRSMAFLHTLSDSPTASGYSEIGANDAAITMGAFAGSVGNVPLQSGTVLHEIGHNINLDHGGDDNTNCKPNYLSVMNYLFQFEDLVETRPLDFSNDILADLDENNLNENLGIELATQNSITLETLVGGVGQVPILTLTGIAVDFDRDGDSTETGIIKNINFFEGISDCTFGTLEVLDGYDDWNEIKLDFRDEGAFADGRHTPAVLLNELDLEKFENLLQNVESAIITELVTQLGDLGVTSGPIIDALVLADEAIQEEPPNFVLARSALETAEFEIGQAGIVDSDILALINEAILILENATVADSFALESNNMPSASSQKIIVRDNTTPIDITLSGSDAQGDELIFSIVSPPLASDGALGGITQDLSPTATVTFTPAAGFENEAGDTPSASFTYDVTDVPDGNTSTPATVDIFLNPSVPTALPQSHVIEKNTVLEPSSLNLILEGGDIDGDSLMFIIGEPSSGSLTPQVPVSDGVNAAVSTTYTPPVGFEGIVTFTFFTTDEVDASAAALVRIAVASQEVFIYVESPPSASNNPGEQSKPVIAFNDNSAIAMIIASTGTFDASTINPTSVRFGTIDSGNVIGTSNAVGIHTSSLTFADDHVFDLSAPNVEPNTQNPELTFDLIVDWLGHFKQSAINVDPVNNDVNGEQVVCLTGGFVPVGGLTQQFFGCLSVTVADKEGGGGDPGGETGLDATELAEAVALTEALRTEVKDLTKQEISKKDQNKLVRQVDKVLDNLSVGDSGTALFNLNVYQDLVLSLSEDNPILVTIGAFADTQIVIDFIFVAQNN